MRTRLLFAVPLLAAALAAVPASAGPKPVALSVAPGYDLFVTTEGTQISAAGLPLMTFKGVPLRTFDFAGVGTRAVGPADTVIRRLDTASPASPNVRIELVGLLLESTNVPGYFVTLQSARPAGLPSPGTLEFTFDERGVGGLLRSELLVNYDVRYGAPDGPIVATGTTGMGFVAEDVLWTRSAPSEDDADWCFNVGGGDTICVKDDPLCHDSGGLTHQHCTAGKGIPLITGVNHRLNGRNTAADFHAVGTASRR